MPTGFQGNQSSGLRDFGVLERDLAMLRIASITREPGTGRVTQVVHAGSLPDGETVRVTTVVNRDAQGRVASLAKTFEGGGGTLTRTETFTRDADGRVSASTIS